MFGHPDAERATLESTYEDIADIKRVTVTVDADNLAKKTLETIRAGVICALSRGGDQSAQTDAQHNIRHDFKVFLPPDTDVKAGDTLSVYRFGRIMPTTEAESFEIIGVPLRYLTHIEATAKAVSIA